jgi:hypothetical protein
MNTMNVAVPEGTPPRRFECSFMSTILKQPHIPREAQKEAAEQALLVGQIRNEILSLEMLNNKLNAHGGFPPVALGPPKTR